MAGRVIRYDLLALTAKIFTAAMTKNKRRHIAGTAFTTLFFSITYKWTL
jgi:hypothetical protein